MSKEVVRQGDEQPIQPTAARIHEQMDLLASPTTDKRTLEDSLNPDVDMDGSFVLCFVSTRLDENDNDGVSLETGKVAKGANDDGAIITYFSGKTLKKRMVHKWAEVEEAGFAGTRAAQITKKIFEQGGATDPQKKALDEDKDIIKKHLKDFIKKNKVDMLVLENMCFPANFALTNAVYETIQETGIRYVMHHHDPAQERERFQTDDEWTEDQIARGIMGPPEKRPDKIIVINKATKKMLLDFYGKGNVISNPFQKRTGLYLEEKDIMIMGNVMPFYTRPKVRTHEEWEAYDESGWHKARTDTMRPQGLDKRPPEEAKILDTDVRDYRVKFLPDKEDIVFLLPLRIIPRKFMELGIEWVKRYDERYNADKKRNTVALFTHPWGDENAEYWHGLRRSMRGKGFEHITLGEKGLKFVHTRDLVAPQRRFPLGTPYMVSDMVLIPSVIEGYCNALTEGIYYGRPMGIHPWPVFKTDIEGLGLDLVKTRQVKLPPELQDIKAGMGRKEVDAFIGARTKIAEGLVTDEMLARTRELITSPARRDKAVTKNYGIGMDKMSFWNMRQQLDPLWGDDIRRSLRAKEKA